MTILRIQDDVLEGTDVWLVAAVAVPRPGTNGPVLLTQSDISGSLQLDIYLPGSSTAIYSVSFAKTLVQNGASYAVIHAATVDSLWQDVDDIGHSFAYHLNVADLAPAIMKGGRTYTAVFQIPTTRDGQVKVVFDLKVVALH
jgi:hypothetical protein